MDTNEYSHLQQQKLEAELKLLKTQIHPHFLFNTLNNLYALTLQKSDEAPKVVLKLSEVLSYFLYESNTDKILLVKEIELIKNFIYLEKLRYGSKLKIDNHINGNTTGKFIAPMLIFPFVDNCFKHGVSESIDNPWVRVTINISFNKISVIVENSKDLSTKSDEQGLREGVNITNVENRLRLIYPDKHKLKIDNLENTFKVELEIEFN